MSKVGEGRVGKECRVMLADREYDWSSEREGGGKH